MFNFSFIISMMLSIVWILGRIPIFQKAYVEHLQRLEDDTWLQTQCRDPEFFSRMRQHTDVCEHVRASFQQPALLVGLHACMPINLQDFIPVMEWQTWCVLMIGILILIPNVILPLYRANEFKREHVRILQACSPQIHNGWSDLNDNNNNQISSNILYNKKYSQSVRQPFF
jgi:hypothetical protein